MLILWLILVKVRMISTIWLENTQVMIARLRTLEKYSLKLQTIRLVFTFPPAIFLRMFFNLLRLATENVVDNYLAERCSSKQTVSKIRKRLNNTLTSCYSETGGKLTRYLNLVLSSVAFNWIFFTFKLGMTITTRLLKLRCFVAI